MLKVGSKFYTFDDLSRRLEEFQQIEQVQLWVRDSRTVIAAAKRARRKSLNPALKYAELTYSCVFGGRRPSDQTKTHNQTSAGGCPFKVRLSTSIDGQALVVKEICHDHNHEPGKKLHEEPRRLYKNRCANRSSTRKQVRYLVNKRSCPTGDDGAINSSSCASTGSPTTGLPLKSHLSEPHPNGGQPPTPTIRLSDSPFHHLQLHSQQQKQQIKLQLEQHLELQQKLRLRQQEVLQLDSPDHIDTTDHHLTPPTTNTGVDLLTTNRFFGGFETLTGCSPITAEDQYSYLPPSPISPSSSSSSASTRSGLDHGLDHGLDLEEDEDEILDPIIDLDVALEEALGDLDSVGSLDLDPNLPTWGGTPLSPRSSCSSSSSSCCCSPSSGGCRSILPSRCSSLDSAPPSLSPSGGAGLSPSSGSLISPSDDEGDAGAPPAKRFKVRGGALSCPLPKRHGSGQRPGKYDFTEYDVMLF